MDNNDDVDDEDERPLIIVAVDQSIALCAQRTKEE
jgi:hypothetical protein